MTINNNHVNIVFRPRRRKKVGESKKHLNKKEEDIPPPLRHIFEYKFIFANSQNLQ